MIGDFSEVRGLDESIHAVARSVSAGIGVHLVGPPGPGKFALARRVASLMPPLGEHERTWLVAEYLGAAMQRVDIVERPFRAPHHTVSRAAMLGGAPPSGIHVCRCKGTAAHVFHDVPRLPIGRAAELQLARFGVLLLDDVVEFPRLTLDGLRSALHRMHGAPLIVATSNPCACGWFGFDRRTCTCSEASRQRYAEAVRAALWRLPTLTTIEVASRALEDLRALPEGPSSASLRATYGVTP